MSDNSDKNNPNVMADSTTLRGHRSTNAATKEDFSAESLKKLSDFRKSQVMDVIESRSSTKYGDSGPGVVSISSGKNDDGLGQKYSNGRSIMKKSDITLSTSTSGTRGNMDRMMPEIYSPLFQVANLNLPRDRMTMNAWNSNFYDTHPIVRNAITLHATYPISKINVKCKHRKVEQFFNDMADKIDLFDAIAGVSHEFWKQGEAFPYAELDENSGIWSSIVVQNPSYITVNKSSASNTSVISLRPDEVMKKLVTSNNPKDVKLRSQIPDNIIYHIRKNEPIPLDNFNISHLKMLSSPYDVRGTSIIVSCYKALMQFDKLFECYDENTEVLTNQGFKKYNDVISIDENDNPVPNTDYKIACYNVETEEMEYRCATNAILRDYSGKMMRFNSKVVDVMVTPGHRMFAAEVKRGRENKYEFIEAKNLDLSKKYKFKTSSKFCSGADIDIINFANKLIPAHLFMKFLGYVLSEGSFEIDNRENHKKKYRLAVGQKITSDIYSDIETTMLEISKIIGCSLNYSKNKITPDGVQFVEFRLSDKNFITELSKYICLEGSIPNSLNKLIPRQIFDYSIKLQKILLDALVAGDGTVFSGKRSTRTRYYTSSKQLADDVQELAYKCGFIPYLYNINRNINAEYIINWSDSNVGKTPIVDKNNITEEQYKGKVWCLEVPTSAMIIRHNGRISIQGNCKLAQADELINPITLISVGGTGEGEFHPSSPQLEAYRDLFEAASNDKNTKIITHAALKVERIGANGGIVDTQNDFNFIREMLYAGLMVPKSIMDTEGTAYASASVGLEVLRTRYITFRNMLEKWLEKKIFAPISQIQGFFEYRNGEKMLIVPQIDWNHINLYDMNDYIQALGGYVEKKEISVHTLYRSLGLNWEEEQRLIREEMVRGAILAKEGEELKKMGLMELRALDPDEAIVETANESEIVPGQAPPGSEDGSNTPEMSTMPDMGMMPMAGGAEESGAPPTAESAPALGEIAPVATPTPPPNTGPVK